MAERFFYYSSGFLRRPQTKSSYRFDVYQVNFKSTGRFCEIFVASLENLNFILWHHKPTVQSLLAWAQDCFRFNGVPGDNLSKEAV